jgi:hypothetical protein
MSVKNVNSPYLLTPRNIYRFISVFNLLYYKLSYMSRSRFRYNNSQLWSTLKIRLTSFFETLCYNHITVTIQTTTFKLTPQCKPAICIFVQKCTSITPANSSFAMFVKKYRICAVIVCAKKLISTKLIYYKRDDHRLRVFKNRC